MAHCPDSPEFGPWSCSSVLFFLDPLVNDGVSGAISNLSRLAPLQVSTGKDLGRF